MGQTALQSAMLMTVLGSGGLAVFLLLRAGGAAGSRPLAAWSNSPVNKQAIKPLLF